MKVLNVLFVSFVAILICMSLLALIAIHMTLAHFSFSFTPTGFSNYLDSYTKYGALFGGTIATTGVFFGLLRAHSAAEQNRDKLRQDRFSEWKTVLEIRSMEIEKSDPYMRREFIRLRWQFFLELYSRNFTISDKATLSTIFTSVFRDLVPFFEAQNNKHVKYGGVYPNETFTYTLLHFRFLFLGSVDELYQGIDNDLQELYISALSQDRTINMEMYEFAIKSHRNVA